MSPRARKPATVRTRRAIAWPTAAVVLLLGIAIGTAVGGLFSLTSAGVDGADAADCVHPYPCGGEWPDDLEGPFSLREVIYERVAMDDGVEIELWVGLPDLPPGVPAPVVAHYTPYVNFCTASSNAAIYGGGVYCTGGPNDPAFWQDPDRSGPAADTLDFRPATVAFGLPPIRLVEEGYAVAVLAMRGTAGSGGCIDAGGVRDQADGKALVEWLSDQPWSNGRIGMIGFSWPSYLQFMTAIDSPEPLKAMVMAGDWANWYSFFVSPQGAVLPTATQALTDWEQTGGVYPPVWTMAPPQFIDPTQYASWADALPERACPGLATRTAAPMSLHLLDDRDADGWWAERDLQPRLHTVQAALLNLHGLLDNGGHAWQMSELWRLLAGAPQRWVIGDWGHVLPGADLGFAGIFPDQWAHHEYESMLFDWFDYWLKGLGDGPEHLHQVDYQDLTTAAWSTATGWPPSDATEEVLYLAGDAMTVAPAAGDRTFTASPGPENVGEVAAALAGADWFLRALCPDPLYQSGVGVNAVAWVAEPQGTDVTIAGNPFAYLTITSDLPSGEFSMRLFDLHPDFSCNIDGRATGYDAIAWGSAHLRYHAGNTEGIDFPVDAPTMMRLDLHPVSQTLPAGHRLAVVVGYNPVLNSDSPHPATITVQAAGALQPSHVVLPVVSGTLGGSPASMDYPPMPMPPSDDGST